MATLTIEQTHADFGAKVTGVDLTAEYVATGRVLCEWLGLGERVQLRDITVLKSGGPDGEERREAFDRSKIEQSVALACRKRGIAHERLDQLVSGIQRQIETLGESEVDSKQIGEMVMDGLRQLDSVAYIRFASVYRDFSEARDFQEFASSVRDMGDT